MIFRCAFANFFHRWKYFPHHPLEYPQWLLTVREGGYYIERAISAQLGGILQIFDNPSMQR